MPECSENPVFVDCDGNPLPAAVNSDGDDVIVMCQDTSPAVSQWDSSTIVSPPLPCTEGVYEDTNNGCLSHYCIGGRLYAFCGEGGGGTTPGNTQICYDVSNSFSGLACFGGTPTAWTVNSSDLINPSCAGVVQNETRFALFESSSVTDNHFGVTPPGVGQLATLLGGAQNTNEPPGFNTFIKIGGSPSNPVWFGAQQPLAFVEIGFASGAVIPAGGLPTGFGIQFQIASSSSAGGAQQLVGDFGVAFWDSTTDSFVPISSAGGAGGNASLSIETLPGMGDWVRVDGTTVPNGAGNFFMSLAPAVDISAEGIYIILTGLGQNSNSSDLVGEFLFDYAIDAVAECCDCYAITGIGSQTDQPLHERMTQVDPNGVTWTISNGVICGEVPDSVAANYGDLTFCSNRFENGGRVVSDLVIINPNGNNQPPTITTGSTFSVPENQTSAFVVNATDDFDNGNLFYSIAGGPDGNRFDIDEVTGTVTFISPPDFEDPFDANLDNTYEVIVSARDSQGSIARQTVLVTVTDVAETVCQPIDPALLDIRIVPGDASSDHGPNRTDGQWLFGGDRMNSGTLTGNFLSPPLTMDSSTGQVDGPFVQEAGTATVLSTENAVDGVLSIRQSMQYVKDGSYLTPTASPPHGFVNSPPSHELFFDGTRNEISYIGTPLAVGVSGAEIKYATSFIVEGWMFADDFTTSIYEHHVPVGQSGTSPVGTSIRNGELIVFARYSATPVTAGSNTNGQTTGMQLGTVTLPPVGTRVSIIYDYKIDPAGSGYFRLHQKIGGTCQTVITHDHQYGFTFSDSNLNQQFYPQLLKMYNFHEFVNSGQATENWDGTGTGTDNSGNPVTWNNTRELYTSHGSLTTNSSATVDDLCDDINFYTSGVCGGGTVTGGIQGTPDNQIVNFLTTPIDVLGDVAPTNGTDAVEWLYSTDGGTTFTVFDAAAQFPVRSIAYEQCEFDGFDTAPTSTDWEIYNGPGHDGNGLRDPAQISIGPGTDNPAQTSLFITGSADATNGVRAGGIAHLENNRHTYGRWRTRMRADLDPTQTFSALALLWNPDNGNNVVPLPGGEIDWVEMLAGDADTRTDIAAFIHADDGTGNDNNFFVAFPPALDGTVMREYTVERAPRAVYIYHNDGAGQQLVATIESANTPIPHGPMHVALQLDAFQPTYTGPDVSVEYEWLQVCRLVDQDILVKARLVADPTQETATSFLRIAGAQDQIEFSTDLPDGTDRTAGSFVNISAAWNRPASYQWQYRDSAGNTLWTDATGTGNSGFGTSSTYGADVVVTPGRYYRLVVQSGANGDYWVSNDTFTNII